MLNGLKTRKIKRLLKFFFDSFSEVGFKVNSDDKEQYVIFSECGKMNYFAHRYERFKKLLEAADIEEKHYFGNTVIAH